MKIIVSENKIELGKKAAIKGASLIKETIAQKGSANIIVATGASQFEMLEVLVKENIDWSKVTAFHLDEYIGIDETHPASFRKYLKERFVEIVNPKEFIFVNGSDDADAECIRLEKIITQYPIDVAFVGIGENAHLAFNDPPADFETEVAYLVVNLDKACREQQMGEGWFPTLEDVPKQAISMSIKQILKSKHIICSIPDKRKAEAIKSVVESEITPDVPSSILKNHSSTYIYLDSDSASLM